MKTFTTYLFALCFALVVSSTIVYGQSAKEHTVLKGETLYGISRHYNLSVNELLKLNPQAEEGLKPGMVLKVQAAKAPNTNKSKSANNKVHQVKSGETLYKIARMYRVTVDDILKANPKVSINDMKVGMVLDIPRVSSQTAQRPEAQLDSSLYQVHKVLKGETAYSLSKKYNITLDTLYFINPSAQKGLHIGQELLIPKKSPLKIKDTKSKPSSPQEQLATDEDTTNPPPVSIADTADLSSEFFFYKVKTGDSYYALKNRYKVTQEELLKLNPELKDGGLKVNQYIIIPKKQSSKELGWFKSIFKNVEEKPLSKPSAEDKKFKERLNKGGTFTDTTAGAIFKDVPGEDTLRVDTTLPVRVGVMLPFFEVDSIDGDTSSSKLKVPSKSKVALDFYNGFLLAADSIAQLDFNLLLDVMNTHNNQDSLEQHLQKRQNVNFDLIVGPLYGQRVEYVADYYRDDGVPVVSPLSNAVNIDGRPNLIKAIPQNSRQETVIAEAINNHYPNHRVIFVHKGMEEEQKQVIQIKSRLQSRSDTGFLDDVVFTEEMLKRNELSDFVTDEENELFVMLSEDQVFISDMVNKLQALNDSTLSVVCTHKTLFLPTISYQYLEALEMTAPGIHFIDYENKATVNFVKSFRDTYQYEPSRFALQGYDVGLFFLEQLRSHRQYFLESLAEARPQRMLNSGFALEKIKDGGYANKYMYLTGVRNMQLVLLDTYAE